MKTKWIKVAIVAVVGMFVAMGPQSKTDAGDSPKKISICHKGQTLELPEPAIQAHLGHGDTLGPCSITPSKNQ